MMNSAQLDAKGEVLKRQILEQLVAPARMGAAGAATRYRRQPRAAAGGAGS